MRFQLADLLGSPHEPRSQGVPLRRRSGVQGILLVVTGTVLGILGAAPAMAQLSLEGAEASYLAALADYDVLLEERELTFSRYEQALDRVDGARVTGDEASRAAAHADFQVVAFDLMDLELSAEQAGARVAVARASYLAVLEAREEVLLSQLDIDQPPDPEREAALLEQWRQVRTRTLEVQADVLPEEATQLRPVPELTVDPRDGPVESLEKARFMEEQALSYDSLIVDLGTQIEELERQVQQRQSVQDLLRDVGRFGADFLPAPPPGLASAPDGRVDGDVLDPTGTPPDPDAALAQLPLNEQVALLRGARDLAVQYRDQALAMARVFRDRAEGMR